MLDADGQADVAGVTPAAASAASSSCECVVLAGMDGERPRVADIGDVVEQLQLLDEGLAASFPPSISKPMRLPMPPFRCASARRAASPSASEGWITEVMRGC
jgi:hypothetical protein